MKLFYVMICDSSSFSANGKEMRSSIKARLAPCGENAGTLENT